MDIETDVVAEVVGKEDIQNLKDKDGALGQEYSKFHSGIYIPCHSYRNLIV